MGGAPMRPMQPMQHARSTHTRSIHEQHATAELHGQRIDARANERVNKRVNEVTWRDVSLEMREMEIDVGMDVGMDVGVDVGITRVAQGLMVWQYVLGHGVPYHGVTPKR